MVTTSSLCTIPKNPHKIATMHWLPEERDVDELKQHLIDVKASSTTSWWVAQMSLSVNLCEKKTFWVYNLTPVMHLLFCISCSLILRILSKCYCVKCSRILPISVFYLSQGSVATHLRCGEQVSWVLLQICRRIQQWKNFENRPIIYVKVMNECIVAQFFWLTA